MADMTLQDLYPGQAARVIGLQGGSAGYRQRLLAMGLTPGTCFTITRVAPLGDPLELHVRGCSLTIRRSEASIVAVEVLSP
ncbi:FeoA family protein [Haematospirillum jordaniae]|nr:FeoA family protein [Haematospirillum jordaniae]